MILHQPTRLQQGEKVDAGEIRCQVATVPGVPVTQQVEEAGYYQYRQSQIRMNLNQNRTRILILLLPDQMGGRRNSTGGKRLKEGFSPLKMKQRV